ncbi:Cytochrome P450 [Penicillium coprophilum]|uniref:Cytochrome P450 n=1 Tax=Penicillium coprophilum TaxID=36646 RepID=UPI00239953B6|nr:Cytochrome P450 [Penicillium coprophilum]KAJ5173752.1 Cytochrome P450 [Penicillium coprophilum]
MSISLSGFPFSYAAVAGGLYLLGLAIYRVYLSPLRHFPGPKLAAATQWYETYYEMWYRGGGMFTRHIKELHEQYGPIVRINPWELHIDDPEFYETIYPSSAPFDKLAVYENRFGIPSAAFSTAAHAVHKKRRAALSPFFTKGRIQARAPFLQQLIDKVCDRLESENVKQQTPLVLNHVFACFSADSILSLAFGDEPTFIDTPTWQTPFVEAMDALVKSTHLNSQFPFMVSVANAIPEWILLKTRSFGPVVQFRQSLNARIARLFSPHAKAQEIKNSTGENATLFEVLLTSSLPPEELTETRLQHESVSIVGAGFDTTREMLSTIAYHVLANPETYRKLRDELHTAIPDPSQIPTWAQLQQLPYLTACIEEGLRIGFGTVQRSPRISPTPFTYGKYTIPPGTPVSEDTYHMHTNEHIFPDPDVYRPERWLGNPRGPDGVKQLSRYNVAFGRGGRMCLGMQLAYAAMYLMIASLIRRFDLELFETSREDVEFYYDWLVPHARLESKGVRVLVKMAA